MSFLRPGNYLNIFKCKTAMPTTPNKQIIDFLKHTLQDKKQTNNIINNHLVSLDDLQTLGLTTNPTLKETRVKKKEKKSTKKSTCKTSILFN